MPKSGRLIQISAALPLTIARFSVAELPQLIIPRNTKSDPDLVETCFVVRHRLALDFFLRRYSSEG
jgi:hypothetical protein